MIYIILIAALLIIGGLSALLYTRGYVSNKIIALIMCASIIFCVLFLSVSGKIAQDIVTVTAENNKNSLSESTNVWIQNASVNNKMFVIKEIDGNWIQEIYGMGWRPGDNMPNITQRIRFNVSTTKPLDLIFTTGSGQGIVTVSRGNFTHSQDLYSPEGGEYTITIPASSNASIFARVGVTTSILAFISLLAAFVIIKLYGNHKKYISTFLTKHIDIVIYAGISLIYLFICIYFSNDRSIWFDEVVQLTQTRNGISFQEMFQKLRIHDGNPPIISIVYWLWLKVVPYGLTWLRLPSIIFASVGVFLCGVVASKWAGRRVGLISVILACTSMSMVIEATYIIRPYALLFLMVILLTWCYMQRFKYFGKERPRDIVLFSVLLIVLLYTHYFGMFIACAFGLIDVGLYLLKKIHIRCAWAYIIAIAFYAPWAIVAMLTTINAFPSFGWTVANLQSFTSLLDFLFNDNQFYKYFFIAACVSFIVNIFYKNSKKNINPPNQSYIGLHFLWVIVFTIGFIFFYSMKINPDRQFIVQRYFISVLPFIIWITAYGLEMLLQALHKGCYKKSVICYVTIASIAFYLWCPSFLNFAKSENHHYQASAEWLLDQPDIYQENVMTIISSGYKGGWQYFITRDGEFPEVPCLDAYDIQTGAELDQYNRIYLYNVSHVPLERLTVLSTILGEQFYEVARDDASSMIAYDRY